MLPSDGETRTSFSHIFRENPSTSGATLLLSTIKVYKLHGLSETADNGLFTKVNLGASTDHYDENEELEKVEIANKFGADTIMDLTDEGDIDGMRRKVLAKAKMPVGTVPIYQLYYEMVTKW